MCQSGGETWIMKLSHITNMATDCYQEVEECGPVLPIDVYMRVILGHSTQDIWIQRFTNYPVIYCEMLLFLNLKVDLV